MRRARAGILPLFAGAAGLLAFGCCRGGADVVFLGRDRQKVVEQLHELCLRTSGRRDWTRSACLGSSQGTDLDRQLIGKGEVRARSVIGLLAVQLGGAVYVIGDGKRREIAALKGKECSVGLIAADGTLAGEIGNAKDGNSRYFRCAAGKIERLPMNVLAMNDLSTIVGASGGRFLCVPRSGARQYLETPAGATGFQPTCIDPAGATVLGSYFPDAAANRGMARKECAWVNGKPMELDQAPAVKAAGLHLRDAVGLTREGLLVAEGAGPAGDGFYLGRL